MVVISPRWSAARLKMAITSAWSSAIGRSYGRALLRSLPDELQPRRLLPAHRFELAGEGRDDLPLSSFSGQLQGGGEGIDWPARTVASGPDFLALSPRFAVISRCFGGANRLFKSCCAHERSPGHPGLRCFVASAEALSVVCGGGRKLGVWKRRSG